jgi:hypothetical protein
MADQQVYVLDRDTMMRLWLSTKVQARQMSQLEADRLWRRYQTESRFLANYFSVTTDIALLTKLANDLGTPIGRVYFKTYGQRAHIIFKGYPGLRTILTGTRYGVQHAKIVNMGLGRAGVRASARSGGILSIFLLTAWNIADYVLRDEATLGGLLGAIGSDVVKVAVAGAIGAQVGAMAVGTVIGSFALGPLAVAVIIGIGVGLALDYIDNRYQLTARLQDMLERGIANLERRAREARETVDSTICGALAAAGEFVIDLAIDYVTDQARRRLSGFRWRFVPHL